MRTYRMVVTSPKHVRGVIDTHLPFSRFSSMLDDPKSVRVDGDQLVGVRDGVEVRASISGPPVSMAEVAMLSPAPLVNADLMLLSEQFWAAQRQHEKKIELGPQRYDGDKPKVEQKQEQLDLEYMDTEKHGESWRD